MALRLLTPQESRDSVNQDTARNAIRAKDTVAALQKLNIDKAKAEADFASALARFRERWAKEEQEHNDWVRKNETEVKELEHRRAQALVPISIDREKADNLLNEANLLMSKVRDRESRTEGLESLLEARLEEVGEVKEELEEDKKKQDSAWTGIKSQQESVKRQSEFLARSIADFQAKVALMESDLASRKRKVELSEINIEARLDMVKRREEENTKEAKKLSDIRATLEREYKRRGIPF
jgi:hypothetical protein